jgi:acetyl-CoA synthetase
VSGTGRGSGPLGKRPTPAGEQPLRGSYNLGVACSDVPASRIPERPALIHERGERTEVVTFAELASRSSSLAARLVAAGVAPGDRVGVFASAGNDTAIAHVAVMKAGAVTVPLVPLLGDDAIAYRLEDAGITCVLAEERESGRLGSIVSAAAGEHTVMVLEEVSGAQPHAAAAFSPHPAGARHPAMIIYSSGTTGKPKGAVEHHAIVLGRHAPMSMIHAPFVPGDVFWTPVDWMWIGSFVDSLLTPLSYGCTVLAYDRRKFDGVEAVRRITSFGVTKAFIPPTALRLLMDVPDAEWEGHRLTSIHSGGETLTAEAFAWARDRLGVTVDEIYGMTEASFVVGNAHRYYPPVPGSMGRPYPGQEVLLRTDDGSIAGPAEPGEITIGPSSPSLFLGYFNKPDATAERFADGWFRTGDLALRDERGHLFYVGRKDDLIMSAGHRLGPGEIEEVLRRHAAVRAAVVVGVPDAKRGQRVKAVVQLVEGAAVERSLDQLNRELQDLVRDGVGKHAYPREIEYVEEFPRTVTGKVRRDLLRLPDGGGAAP